MFWAFKFRIGEYFEELHIISKVRLDDNQVTFFLLLWKYISISPYVETWQGFGDECFFSLLSYEHKDGFKHI